MTPSNLKKVAPAEDYPPEEGCYLRGNDYSPVAVVVPLRWEREKTPPSIERLVRTAVQSCYQESPTAFLDYMLCDPGAYPATPLRIVREITVAFVGRVSRPVRERRRVGRPVLRQLFLERS